MRSVIQILCVATVLAAAVPPAAANAEQVVFEKRDLSGPRFGMTYIPGNTELFERMQREDMDRIISQFGWHFERRVIPHGGGPQFVVEFVPMLAGVEYGKFVPNMTLAMGVRMPSGIEFGLGPNFFATKDLDGKAQINTSLVTALGKSFSYGGVSIPINIALATAPEGNRLSLIVGYAIGRVDEPQVAARDLR
jgi:hypothetical protein